MAVERREIQRREDELRALREALEKADRALDPLRDAIAINSQLYQAGRRAGVAVGAYKNAGARLRKAAQQVAAAKNALTTKRKARERGLQRYRARGTE